MANIIESPTKPPHLPRCTVFDYLFPIRGQDKTLPAYEIPSRNSIAFIDGSTGRTLTRGDVERQALQLAGGLLLEGVKSGDVACIFGTNSLEWINALFGCQAGGIIVSPASYGYSPLELLHQMQDSGAKAVFVGLPFVAVLEDALRLPDAPEITRKNIFLLCSKRSKPSDSVYRCIEELWAGGFKPGKMVNGGESATTFLCYSSGTTGRAKGVETSHYNMTSQVQALNIVYEPLDPATDVILGILPFSHIYGLSVGLHQPLTRGVPVVVLPRYEEKTVTEAIVKYKITWGLIVPPILLAFLHSKTTKLSDLKTIRGLVSGAAPLGPELVAAFQDKFPWISVTQGYGLTETSPVVHVMNLEDSKKHAGKIGKLMPTFQARLVDPETGKDVEQDGRGELWLRGPSVTKGYWKNAEATRNSFAPGGWFKTGDIAAIDEEGYFSIVDRLKELIKYKGFQVPPAELEAILLSHPKVADVAVIGVYSEEQVTELPRAYIVPTGGLASIKSAKQRRDIAEDVAKWVQGHVAHYKYLRGGVKLIEAVPKSPTGKILRKDLRELAKREDEDGVHSRRHAKL